jgi:hypothetical protein
MSNGDGRQRVLGGQGARERRMIMVVPPGGLMPARPETVVMYRRGIMKP